MGPRAELRQTRAVLTKESRMFPSRLSIALALCCAHVLSAHAQAPAPGSASAAPGFDNASVVYRCGGGVKLPVVYLNITGGDSFATTYVNGALALMRSGPTGSGANYYPVDDKLGYRWQVKGDLGTLWYRRAGDPSARETMLLQDCKAQRAP